MRKFSIFWRVGVVFTGALWFATVQARDVGIAASNPGLINLPVVNAGEFAFGISNENEMKLAVTGSGHIRGRAYKNLRPDFSAIEAASWDRDENLAPIIHQAPLMSNWHG